MIQPSNIERAARLMNQRQADSFRDGIGAAISGFSLVCIASVVFFNSYEVLWLPLFWKFFLTFSAASIIALLIGRSVGLAKHRRTTMHRLVQHEARLMEKMKQLEEFRKKEGEDT